MEFDAIDWAGNKIHHILRERAGLIAEQVLDLSELLVYVGTIADQNAVFRFALKIFVDDHVFGAEESGHLETHVQRDRYEKVEEHEKIQKVFDERIELWIGRLKNKF